MVSLQTTSLQGFPQCPFICHSRQEWVSGDQWLAAPSDWQSLCFLGLTLTSWKRGGESGLFFLNHHFCSTTEQDTIAVQAQ